MIRAKPEDRTAFGIETQVAWVIGSDRNVLGDHVRRSRPDPMQGVRQPSQAVAAAAPPQPDDWLIGVTFVSGTTPRLPKAARIVSAIYPGDR
jgi:hypothetical protein